MVLFMKFYEFSVRGEETLFVPLFPSPYEFLFSITFYPDRFPYPSREDYSLP